jgi:hypothetical protein
VKYNVNYQSKSSTNSESGQRALWVSVIAQAIFDATANLTVSSRQEAKWDRAAARSWLLDNNKDFAGVCALAGLDPDWVRARARKIIEGTASKPKQVRSKRERRGVGQNFREGARDRPGSVAQDRAEMEFS